MKSIFLRRFFIGVPTIIIQDGEFIYEALKKQNMDINDVLEQARSSGYFDLKEISYAIMEANGKISFLEKDAYKSPTKKDLKLKKEKESLPANIIIDGNLMEDNIKDTNKPKEWFVSELKKQGYKAYNDILLATYQNNTIDIYTKNKSNAECLASMHKDYKTKQPRYYYDAPHISSAPYSYAHFHLGVKRFNASHIKDVPSHIFFEYNLIGQIPVGYKNFSSCII